MTDIKKATEFTVVRSKWARGRRFDDLGYVQNQLLGHDGMQCCMGFYAEACGYEKNELLYKGNLFGLSAKMGQIENEVVCSDSSLHYLYEVNDSSTIDDEDRERLITEHLAARGVTVHFVDE